MSPDTVIDILLVEDNPNDVELTLRALKKQNLANPVHVAKDGAEALDFLFATGAHSGRAAERNPKVVLLDMKLPKVDGMEVLRRMRSAEKTRLIPVVMLTSSQMDRDVIESYRLGVNSYIVKPVDFEQFVKAVAEVGLYWLLVNQPPP
ncbi:MAG: response regulator [Planctomycetes bacterium]|nr:response regulator [Planctomycetota bacterium]